MTIVESLPNRPLYLHEIRSLKLNSKKINNSEALFYDGDNINGAICFFLNINGTGYMLVFNPDESTWVNLSKIDSEDNEDKYDDETDSILEWIEDKYDDYGIYGMDESPD
jgi:hypothetical protein